MAIGIQSLLFVSHRHLQVDPQGSAVVVVVLVVLVLVHRQLQSAGSQVVVVVGGFVVDGSTHPHGNVTGPHSLPAPLGDPQTQLH